MRDASPCRAAAVAKSAFGIPIHHFFWFFSVTLSMRKLLTAFSSESGLKGCRVRLCPGRDGSAKRERISALACWPLRMPGAWGRGR